MINSSRCLYLQRRSSGTCLAAVASLLRRQRTHLPSCTPAASLHIHPVSFPGSISALPRPFTTASSTKYFAQTCQQPSPLRLFTPHANQLGGVLLQLREPLAAASHKALFHHRKPCVFRGFCSNPTTAMPTVSQPQTPAALDSPLREHRHRPVERLTDRLETPSLDDRSYRVIKLPNQLEVLLVHDAETDKASAAMDVNVGNFSDPEDFPGKSEFHKILLLSCCQIYGVLSRVLILARYVLLLALGIFSNVALSR